MSKLFFAASLVILTTACFNHSLSEFIAAGLLVLAGMREAI